MSVRFGLYSPCTVQSAAAVTFTNAWVEYEVDLVPLKTACHANNPAGWNAIRWDWRPGARFALDSVRFYCNGVPCTTVPPATAASAGVAVAGLTPAAGASGNSTNRGDLAPGAIAGWWTKL